MTALREVLAFFQVDWDKSSLDAGGKAVDSAVDKLKKFGAVLASSAIVVGLKNMVSGLQVQGDSLGKTSVQLGLATDELQAYRHAAALGSVATEQFDQSLRTLQRNQDMAAQGGAEQAASFKRLGIDVEIAKGKLKTLDQLLPELADGLAGIESPAERSALAQKILGDAGARLLPMFSQGAAGLAAARKEIELLGGGITSDVVKDLEELGDAETRLNVGLTSLKVQLAKGVFPVLTGLAEKLAYGLGRLSRFTNGIRETAKNSNILTGTFTVLGAAGVGKLFAMAGGWTGIGKLIMQASRVLGVFLLRLALPALLIDELITTWQGGDTIISRSIDKLFGEGSTAKVIGFFKFITSGWDAAEVTLEEGAFMLGAILVGTFDAIGFGFTRVSTGIQDDAAAMWNWLVDKTAAGVAKIQSILGDIPGIGGLLSGASEKLAGLKASGGNLEQATQAYESRKGERIEAFDASKARLSDAMGRFATQQNVSAPTQINVTVPPGTPATLANRVGQATSKAVTQSRRATKAATQNQVD